ncbi:hypothetical protein PILCRDRAFT_820245 [Piloderma croceum F 1598]|uniref:Uncharacterized protein n=1 Tax=Piloderma croceum (strain F 1598) TaxID=765440 RepID=A0A0C3FU36_PILCF|nr:hypothetical protein PILCRDRAFT_820245 [Piloderma croceum F 1598]
MFIPAPTSRYVCRVIHFIDREWQEGDYTGCGSQYQRAETLHATSEASLLGWLRMDQPHLINSTPLEASPESRYKGLQLINSCSGDDVPKIRDVDDVGCYGSALLYTPPPSSPRTATF